MYVGLDIGTSGTKAALVKENGNVLKEHQINYKFSNLQNGYRELDAKEVWMAVKECLYKVGHDETVKTVTVSALGEAIILLDRSGSILGPSITGTDQRGAEEMEEICSRFQKDYLTNITGLNMSSIYSANKIVWLKKHRKPLYKKAWKIVTFQDFIIYKLTGETLIDFSMASRTLLFDIQKNDWCEELLKGLEIEREKLSIPIRGGSIVGKINRNVADEIGISTAIQIVAGTHDHIGNAIGSGTIHYGECTNTVGTTEGLTALINREQLNTKNIVAYQISCEPFVLPGVFNTVAWNNTSGVLLRWFTEEFIKKDHNDDLIGTYKKLNAKMHKEPTKLLVLPHFSGAATPYMDSQSKGAILGLTLGTSSSEIYKALMEGANYELALILECLKKTGFRLSKLTATGGALSRQLLQIKADILGIEIHTVQNKQTGILGGAILGAVAVGDFDDLSDAVRHMVKMADVYEPDEYRRKIYQERMRMYQKLYPMLVEINHELV